MKQLQVVQNSTARLVSWAHRRDHAMPLLCNLHWLPMGQRFIFRTAVLVQKCIHGVAAVYLQELCTQVDSIRIRGRSRLRSAPTGCIQLPRVQASVAPQSFAYNWPAVWNSLSATLRDSSVSLHIQAPTENVLICSMMNTIRHYFGTVLQVWCCYNLFIRLLTYLLILMSYLTSCLWMMQT